MQPLAYHLAGYRSVRHRDSNPDSHLALNHFKNISGAPKPQKIAIIATSVGLRYSRCGVFFLQDAPMMAPMARYMAVARNQRWLDVIWRHP